MPIPSPTNNENADQYISRCIAKIYNEYGHDQATAICKNKWSNKNMSKTEEVFVLKPTKNENRGKYLERCSKNNRMRLQYPNMRERLNSCLHGFNSFYKYWNKMEDFAGVPADSALGECIAREKAKGADYRIAYASCSTKVVSPSGPVVLSEEDDNNLIEEPVLLADYPWDECIADQLDKGHSEETANKICGYIKAQNA